MFFSNVRYILKMWMSDQGFVPGAEIALENLPVSSG